MFATERVDAASAKGLDHVGALNEASVHLVNAANV